jgi:hypothetical protein
MGALSYAVTSFFLVVIIHMICARVFSSVNRVKSFVAAAALIGCGLAVVALCRTSLDIAISSLVLYAFLCELYLFAFTLALGSISANLLVRLRRGSLPLRRLNEHYSGELMTTIRLERLCQSGLLEGDSDGWILTPRGRRLAKVFAKLRRFFRHGHPASKAVA